MSILYFCFVYSVENFTFTTLCYNVAPCLEVNIESNMFDFQQDGGNECIVDEWLCEYISVRKMRGNAVQWRRYYYFGDEMFSCEHRYSCGTATYTPDTDE